MARSMGQDGIGRGGAREVDTSCKNTRLTLGARGTYALILELSTAARLRIGRLGVRVFKAGVYFYAGSAFGPGGLSARLTHHLHASERPHWHIDYLRRVAPLAQIWTTKDPRRLECAWSAAARRLRGARTVPGFGASDCRCSSHLIGLPRAPRPATFRRHLNSLDPPCVRIRVFEIVSHRGSTGVESGLG